MKTFLIVLTKFRINELHLKRLRELSDDYELILLNLSEEQFDNGVFRQVYLPGSIGIVDALNLVIEQLCFKHVEELYIVSCDMLDVLTSKLTIVKEGYNALIGSNRIEKFYVNRKSNVIVVSSSVKYNTGSLGSNHKKQVDFTGINVFVPVQVYREIGGITKKIV